MRKLTKEDVEVYDKVTNDASSWELFVWSFWDIFCPKKREALHKEVMKGMSWKFAYNKAKHTKC